MNRISLILVIIGALNWASVGLFNFDAVSAIFGTGATMSRIVFAIIGLAGLWCISLLFREHRDVAHENREF